MTEKITDYLFWYEFIFRGLSPGCQPSGFLLNDPNRGKFGAVAYPRALTASELAEYELKFLGSVKVFTGDNSFCGVNFCICGQCSKIQIK